MRFDSRDEGAHSRRPRPRRGAGIGLRASADAGGRRSRLHNRLQLRPSGRLLQGLRGGRRVVHGIAAAFAALVAGRLDHAKEAVDGYIRRVRPRGKEELVGLAALRCAVAEFQVPQAGDGDRGAVRLV